MKGSETEQDGREDREARGRKKKLWSRRWRENRQE